MNASFVLPSREFDARALALLFGTQYCSLIFPRATQRDPIGRHIAIWWIRLVDCSVTYLVYGLFRSGKVGQKSCFEWVVLDAPYLDQFLSDFVWVKNNVSPRPSTFIYPIFEKSDLWPNYPFNWIVLKSNKSKCPWDGAHSKSKKYYLQFPTILNIHEILYPSSATF